MNTRIEIRLNATADPVHVLFADLVIFGGMMFLDVDPTAVGAHEAASRVNQWTARIAALGANMTPPLNIDATGVKKSYWYLKHYRMDNDTKNPYNKWNANCLGFMRYYWAALCNPSLSVLDPVEIEVGVSTSGERNYKYMGKCRDVLASQTPTNLTFYEYPTVNQSNPDPSKPA